MRHMWDAASKAISFMHNKSRKDLTNNEQLSLALVRLIEIIGEAASKVTTEAQNRHPSIPWRKIIGTRNNLIHGYDNVNLDVLWQIVSVDLPSLSITLKAAIDDEERKDQQRLF